MARLFVSYARLDELVAQGRAMLADDRLRWIDGATYRLLPAVVFQATVGGEADRNDLCGRVKTDAQLAELGAEHYKDSVIIGEVGYQVTEGFVGERA